LLRQGADDDGPSLVPEKMTDDAVAAITSPDFPDERLMVCLHPRLRDERGRRRVALYGNVKFSLSQTLPGVTMIPNN